MNGRGFDVAKASLLLASSLVTLVTGALVGEFAARQRERHRETVPGTMPLIYYQHQRLGHALVRGYDYFGWVHIGKEGFRGPEVSELTTPGRVRIVVDGASTTFDPAVSSDDRAWPARLGYWLKQLAPGRDFEVINTGVPGYRVIDNLIRLETELYRYHPDVIILLHSHNDLLATLSARSPEPDAARPGETRAIPPWTRWLSTHSLLYGKLRGRWKAIQTSQGARRARRRPDSEDTAAVIAAIERGAETYERELGMFVTLANGLGIRTVLPQAVHVSGAGTLMERDSTILRVLAQAFVASDWQHVLFGYERFDRARRAVCASRGATCIDTRDFALRGPEWYGDGDAVHFNDRGADQMGRKMAEALLAAGGLGP